MLRAIVCAYARRVLTLGTTRDSRQHDRLIVLIALIMECLGLGAISLHAVAPLPLLTGGSKPGVTVEKGSTVRVNDGTIDEGVWTFHHHRVRRRLAAIRLCVAAWLYCV